ncbi:hypothetical protein BKA93DRAFT_732232 [Sparassis latifolia]
MSNGKVAKALKIPSEKAAGKRRASAVPPPPEGHSETDKSVAPTSAQGSPTKAGMQTRQKRVLPSRSRRGGPGVGACDTDVMILDTMRRRLEGEPLIPAGTRFLLTTNSALVPSSSGADPGQLEINAQAFGRYFDRPEVRRAYKTQQLIQTPEFTQLPDDAHVGGRFRPRGSEDESADTSDAAYEKRHRKYETFEKRVRLREKEQLKHEQYKLKERIEQLRAMDASAFLALSESDFSDAPPPIPHDAIEIDDEFGISHAHGSPAHIEGERRRKEMLDVALGLEERYHTLLPPDRRWLEKKAAMQGSVSLSVEPEPELEPLAKLEPDSSEEEDQLAGDDEPEREVEVLHPQRHDEDGESEVDFEERDRERSKTLKLRIKFPPKFRPTEPPGVSTKQITLSPYLKGSLVGKTEIHTVTKSLGPKRVRAASGKFLPKNKPVHDAGTGKPHLRKRLRTDSSASTGQMSPFLRRGEPGESVSAGPRRMANHASPAASKPYASHPHTRHHERPPCQLVLAAERNAVAPLARKTQRHVTAFGTRVPPEIEDVRDYQIPDWVLPSDENGDGWSEVGGRASSYTVAEDHASVVGSSIAVSNLVTTVDSPPPKELLLVDDQDDPGWTVLQDD